MAEMQNRNPVAALLRLPPAWARLAMLALAAVLAVALYAGLRPAMVTLEERLGALGWTLYVDPTEEQRITLVTIDEASLAEVGPWPWPRETLARLVTAIDEAGAQLQLHDIVYAEPRPGDGVLAEALAASRGAVLAQLPLLPIDQQVRTGVITHPLAGLQCGAGLPQTDRYLAADAAFAGIPKGHIAPIVSSDGSIRKTPAAICVQGEGYPALALSAWLTAVQADNWSATLIDGGGLFGPDQYLRLVAYPDLEIPLDSEGNLRISYASDPSAFRKIPAIDILNGDFDPAWFDNTWALIGVTAFSVGGDIVPTPYAGVAPGVELQTRILASLLDGAIPYTPAADGLLLGLLSAAAAAALFLLATGRNRWSAVGLPVAGVLLPVAMLALHIQLLQGQGVWLGWLFPAVYSPLAAGMLVLLEYGRVRTERGRVFGNLTSYLPDEIAREIAYSLPSSSIDARRAEMTLLCADLRNFAAFGESRPPEESAAVLHFFFTRATRIVEECGGRVHEFKGDGLIAVWDTWSGNAAARALQAAREMQEIEIAEMLPEDSPEGLEPLALGIGIEQGSVLIGSVGPAHRRGHVLLGDTVTIVFRIQELTADLAHPILVGGNAARKLNEEQLKDEKLESQGHFLLSGLRTPHHLFAPPSTGKLPEDRGLKLIHG
ncbi:MAG: adenylate/guanylate cyclase domain-containing protein [Gammaproteobacteria bacterium]|nr:adenylate/guanylate cyclase domain-containing protein [Gammaproteobacteria bacterium]